MTIPASTRTRVVVLLTSIALALVEPHLAASGTIVTIHQPNGVDVTGKVMEHHAHFDPEGVRLRG